MSNQNNPFLEIAAPWIANLSPYVPGKPISELERELGIHDIVKLASNENPLGPGPKARSAIQRALTDLGRYPDGGAFELRRALADYHKISMSSITLGNGSNDLLDIIGRTFLQPGVESVYSQYSFIVYAMTTTVTGATGREAPAKDYGYDLDAMANLVNDKTRVVWMANPNNPTGTWVNARSLKSFVTSLPKHCIVVIDEAYTDYVCEPDFPDSTQWLESCPNLIVVRTLAKAYGLAALRVGYALSHPQVADLLNRVRQPFNVNAVAQAAAAAAITDRDHVRAAVELNRAGMRQLTEGFERLGVAYIPSVANFVTIDLGRPAAPVNDALLRKGVIVRPLLGYGMPNHLRVTIGLEAENERLLQALEEVLTQ